VEKIGTENICNNIQHALDRAAQIMKQTEAASQIASDIAQAPGAAAALD
jgi:hypothetical protein